VLLVMLALLVMLLLQMPNEMVVMLLLSLNPKLISSFSFPAASRHQASRSKG